MHRARTSSRLLVFVLAVPACGVTNAPPVTGDADVSDAPLVSASDGGVPVDASSDASAEDAAVGDAGPVRCPVFDVESPLALTLTHGAFPGSGHPDAAVHVPAGLDACAPVGLIVFFHGFRNCVLNVLGDTDAACSPGGPARTAFGLARQLDAARVNAILVAVELRYDEASSATGELAVEGGLRALLDEVFDEHLAALLGRRTGVAELDRIVLSSHSGGYSAVARGIDRGGIEVDEVQLYDSLYGEVAAFEAFTVDALDRFDPALTRRRFSMVFTEAGGTAGNSRALGAAIGSGLAATGEPTWLLFDDTTATLDPAAFAHPLLVKRSALSHDGVVLYYFERLVRAAGFAPIGV